MPTALELGLFFQIHVYDLIDYIILITVKCQDEKRFFCLKSDKIRYQRKAEDETIINKI